MTEVNSAHMDHSLCIFLFILVAQCLSESVPSNFGGQNPLLHPYDGKHLSYTLTADDVKKLDHGDAVWTFVPGDGNDGRGLVIQDVKAVREVCLERIADLSRYPKVVPRVKNVEIYEQHTFPNRTILTKAKFEVGVMFNKFTYYLELTLNPHFGTYTWTLDYSKKSDFEDNIGHWQVMEHPTEKKWSRILYSCQVKLPSWIPGFVVDFLTKSALVEATTWVKKESERFSGTPKLKKFAQGIMPSYKIIEDGKVEYSASHVEL